MVTPEGLNLHRGHRTATPFAVQPAEQSISRSPGRKTSPASSKKRATPSGGILGCEHEGPVVASHFEVAGATQDLIPTMTGQNNCAFPIAWTELGFAD